MNAIKVKNTAVYEAIQASESGAIKTIKPWLEARPEEFPVDTLPDLLMALKNEQVWVLRHPGGTVAFLTAPNFLMEFEEVEDSDDPFLKLGESLNLPSFPED